MIHTIVRLWGCEGGYNFANRIKDKRIDKTTVDNQHKKRTQL